MTILMTPDMANFTGKVHGGELLSYLDKVAYACASRYAGRYVVTLSVDRVMFRQPINVGRFIISAAEAANIRPAHIINQNENNVRRLLAFTGLLAGLLISFHSGKI